MFWFLLLYLPFVKKATLFRRAPVRSRPLFSELNGAVSSLLLFSVCSPGFLPFAWELDFEYFPIETRPETFKTVANFVRCANFIGLGVTKPDKVHIMEYLDELDPLAEKIGAVNTILVTPEHKLKGYNTDGAGFYLSLQKHWDKPLAETSFFCLGTAGKGREKSC